MPVTLAGALAPLLGLAEPVSSLTHYLSALVAILAAPQLLRSCRGCPTRRMAVIVFVVAVTCLFIASGTFHSLEHGTVAREILRRIDHAAILTLIAGTLTAISVLAFRDGDRKLATSTIWTVALAGIVLETLFMDVLPPWIWLVFYLGLGWAGALAMMQLAFTRGWSRVRLLFAGGMVYTVGALLDSARIPTLIPDFVGPHEVFHLTVCAGALLHWRYLHQLATTTPLTSQPTHRQPELSPTEPDSDNRHWGAPKWCRSP